MCGVARTSGRGQPTGPKSKRAESGQTQAQRRGVAAGDKRKFVTLSRLPCRSGHLNLYWSNLQLSADELGDCRSCAPRDRLARTSPAPVRGMEWSVPRRLRRTVVRVVHRGNGDGAIQRLIGVGANLWLPCPRADDGADLEQTVVVLSACVTPNSGGQSASSRRISKICECGGKLWCCHKDRVSPAPAIR